MDLGIFVHCLIAFMMTKMSLRIAINITRFVIEQQIVTCTTVVVMLHKIGTFCRTELITKVY